MITKKSIIKVTASWGQVMRGKVKKKKNRNRGHQYKPPCGKRETRHRQKGPK